MRRAPDIEYLRAAIRAALAPAAVAVELAEQERHAGRDRLHANVHLAYNDLEEAVARLKLADKRLTAPETDPRRWYRGSADGEAIDREREAEDEHRRRTRD